MNNSKTLQLLRKTTNVLKIQICKHINNIKKHSIVIVKIDFFRFCQTSQLYCRDCTQSSRETIIYN